MLNLLPIKETRQFVDIIDDLWLGNALPKPTQYAYSKFFHVLASIDDTGKSQFIFDLLSAPVFEFTNNQKIQSRYWRQGDNWHLLSYELYGDQQFWWVLVLVTYTVRKHVYEQPTFSIKHILTPEPGSIIHYIEATDLHNLIINLEQKITDEQQSYTELQKWFVSDD